MASACALVMVAFALAMAQPGPNKRPERPGTLIPMRKPIVVIPKAPVAKLPRLPKATGNETRTVELADATGTRRFKVTMTASKHVDPRVLDYLGKTLRVVQATATDRADFAAWQNHPGPGKPGADIAIALASLDGAKVDDFIALPPDGVELIRPGVLRVREDLIAGLAKQRRFKFTGVAVARDKGKARPGGRELHGTLKCRARETAAGAMTTRALPFVKIKIGDVEHVADVDGKFTLPGSFHAGAVTLEIVYDAPIKTTVGGKDITSPLRVMGEVHDARAETVRRTASLAGDRLAVGEIVLTSVDCEIWRLGAEVLVDYHTTMKRSPPAGRLRIKRWSAVWGGTPYTYFDHIVLGTDFARSGRFSNHLDRRGTMFHEFGHSIRHVADGSEAHWGWDNFRWAYARIHGGCEQFNTQLAFNEGWAVFWADARGAEGIRVCDANDSVANLNPSTDKLIDWTEAKVARQLKRLATALSTTAADAAIKMVDVLERNKGTIHSLRDFEVKFCAMYQTKDVCNGVKPARAEPAPCPPDYINDGATCRLNNIIAKASYPRGVGTVPTDCGPGRELDGGLCYRMTGARGDRTLTSCKAGFSAVGPVCWQDCPSGFRDDGAFCAKPAPYTRRGYPWKIGDAPFDLGGARQRCVADHAGGCEQDGLLFYPKCKAGFHAFGCCVCTPNCPSGMADIGVSCQKQSYGRGAGTVPRSCSAGKEYDAGLCYTPCKPDHDGVGPVCWKKGCKDGWVDHGATCYREPSVLVRY